MASVPPTGPKNNFRQSSPSQGGDNDRLEKTSQIGDRIIQSQTNSSNASRKMTLQEKQDRAKKNREALKSASPDELEKMKLKNQELDEMSAYSSQ